MPVSHNTWKQYVFKDLDNPNLNYITHYSQQFKTLFHYSYFQQEDSPVTELTTFKYLQWTVQSVQCAG